MRFGAFCMLAVLFAVMSYSSSASAQIIPKNDVYNVSSPSAVTITTGDFGNGYAACSDTTDTVVGGGCWTSAYSQNVVVTQQYPVPSGVGGLDHYFCEWKNNTPLTEYVHPLVTCVSQ